MSFRFIQAKQIFNGYTFLPNTTVLVLNNQNYIADITTNDLVTDSNIEFINDTISPQFINAHCHIELSHLANKIPKNEGLIKFITNILKYRNEDNEIILEACKNAIETMKNNGICAVGDICNTNFSLEAKLKNNDIYFHNFIEVSGFDGNKANERFDVLKNVYDIFEKNIPFQNSIVPHSPYSVSEKLFDKILQHNSIIQSIHNQETFSETQLFEKGTGDFLEFYKNLQIDISDFKYPHKSSFQYWLQKYNEQIIISVHNCFITNKDIEWAHLSSNKIYFCLCPNANLYIENKLPPVDLLFNTNLNIVLGTDSLASNTHLDIKEEIKTIRKHFPIIPIEKLLQAATINGAKALGIQNKLGSFEIGKEGLFVKINSLFE